MSRSRVVSASAFPGRAVRIATILVGVVVEERPRSSIGRFITLEMPGRVGGFIDVRFRPVRRREDDVVASIDDRHRRHDRLVEILAGRAGLAALHVDLRGVGTDDEYFSLEHGSSFAACSRVNGIVSGRAHRAIRFGVAIERSDRTMPDPRQLRIPAWSVFPLPPRGKHPMPRSS